MGSANHRHLGGPYSCELRCLGFAYTGLPAASNPITPPPGGNGKASFISRKLAPAPAGISVLQPLELANDVHPSLITVADLVLKVRGALDVTEVKLESRTRHIMPGPPGLPPRPVCFPVMVNTSRREMLAALPQDVNLAPHPFSTRPTGAGVAALGAIQRAVFGAGAVQPSLMQAVLCGSHAQVHLPAPPAPRVRRRRRRWYGVTLCRPATAR